MKPRPIDQFSKAVYRHGQLWKSIDLRTLAVKIGRRWVSLVTRGYLDHRPRNELDRLAPVSRPGLRAWQTTLPYADLGALLDGVLSGYVRSRPRGIHFSGRSEGLAPDINYYFNDISSAHRTAKYPFWSGHSLVGYGAGIWELIQEAGLDPLDIDNQIRGGANPYDGLIGLTRYFHGRPEGLDAPHSTTVFELIAPVAVRFDRPSTRAGSHEAILGLRCRSKGFAEHATIEWTAVTSNPVPRHGTIALKGLDWSRCKDGFTAEVQLSQDAPARVQAHIVSAGVCLDRVSVAVGSATTNHRIVAHHLADEGLTELRKALFPIEWKNSQGFEAAVGALFHFFGFQVDVLSAQSALGSAVDSLAHDPYSGATIAIECTLGPIDASGKLGKLIARSSALRSVLTSRQVIPVMVTARPKGELSLSELRKAAHDGVLVLTQEDLTTLLTSAEDGATTMDLLEILQERLARLQLSVRRAST